MKKLFALTSAVLVTAALVLYVRSGQTESVGNVGSAAVPATVNSHVCNITHVDLQMNGSASGNRLLIRCDAPATGVGGASIQYFAVNTAQDSERAKMALSIMTTAKVAGHPVRITYFSDDSSPNAWGMACNPSDCRPIVRIELL